MSKKEVTTSSIVLTRNLFLNSKSFYVLFDSGATHSFISTRAALQLNLQDGKVKANYRNKLPNDSIVECPILYKHMPITLGETIFPGDLIQFDLSDFDII